MGNCNRSNSEKCYYLISSIRFFIIKQFIISQQNTNFYLYPSPNKFFVKPFYPILPLYPYPDLLDPIHNNTMTTPTQKGIQTLTHFYQTFPQAESIKQFPNSLLIEYRSSNPFTNSKKTLRKIYTTSASSTINELYEPSQPLTLRYLEKPARMEVEGGWGGWMVDESLHEGLMQDTLFGKASRSRDGNCWAYVARVRPQKVRSLWAGGEGSKEFVYDYGEGYSGRTHNGIFVRNIKQSKTYKIPNQNNMVMAAPLFLSDDGSKLIFHAYALQQSDGLSPIHTFNRKISLYTATLLKHQYTLQKLESDHSTNLFPALSLCGNYLAYFAGTGKTNSFYLNVVILERCRDEWVKYHELEGFFVGPYMRCKIHFYEQAGSPFFLVETNEKSANVIYSFDVLEKEGFRITDSEQNGENYTIQSFNPETNLLVASYSSPSTLSLAYAFLPSPLTIIPSPSTKNYTSSYQTDPIPHFILRKESSPGPKPPIIVLLHGGPHVSADPGLTPLKYLFLESGYTVLIPNFSGSIGYEKQYLENALGKLGQTEVDEIVKCVQKLITQNKVDANRIYSYGVCYGGYLSATLASKHPHLFAGSIMLNPILSLSHMIYSSDIADWVFVEALNKQNTIDTLTEQENTQIFRLSPVNNLPKVPVIVFVGGRDRRVNPDAAKHYVSLVKKKGGKAELYLYPESDHKLSDSLESFTEVMLKAFRFAEETRKEGEGEGLEGN